MLSDTFFVGFFFCFVRCWSDIPSPSLHPLKAGTKKRCLGSSPSLVVSLVSLIVDLADDGRAGGRVVVAPLTLHSGRSYPGIPERPGSRTGTRPEREKSNSGVVKIAFPVAPVRFY